MTAVLREGFIRFRRKVYCCSSGTGIALVEGCLLPCTGKTNYCGSILGSKAGRNEGGTLGQTCCLHWVEEEPHVGSPKGSYGRSPDRPTVGRLHDLL